MWSSYKVVDLKDVARGARYDHVVSKCTHFVERNRAVVPVGARERRKQREGTGWRGPNDELAECDEDVARGEPGRRGLRWRYSNVFFPTWGRLVQNGRINAGERIEGIDVCIAANESGRKQFSL
jgi:hypothetical protein